MKKQLLLLVMMLLPVVANANIVEIDGIYYYLMEDGKQAMLVSSPTNPNYYVGSVVIPEAVNYEGTEYIVTSIGGYAFYNCSELTSVTIANSVTDIGEGAFQNCTGLTSMTIPSSVTSIGDLVFSNCPAISSLVVNEGNKVYDSRNDCNAIIQTETNNLIRGCQSTIIPNSVVSIDDWAFSYSYGLESISIPESVISLGQGAFYGCTGLTSVSIPNNVTTIGNQAFSGCI